MSITLNHSDFQCLQDQLVDLKTKNYELAEKNRRGQADFEAAKAKICSLQLKLEEQERDFQVTSSTLRREIEVAYNSATTPRGSTNDEDEVDVGGNDNNNSNNNDYRAKYKKLLYKAKELQQRYEKSVEVVQKMDEQIKTLSAKSERFDEENGKLRESLEEIGKKREALEKDFQENLNSAIEEYKASATYDCQEHIANLNAIKQERDNLQFEVNKLQEEVKTFNARLECQLEERKIQDRKGAQMIKELKRELAQEKSRNETIQKRLESFLLSQPASVTNGQIATAADLEKRTKLSTSSSTNGANSRGSRGGADGAQTNLSSSGGQQRDDHSVSSWSLVKGAKTTSTPSICSIESEDRETVHLPPASTTATGNQILHNTSTSCDTFSLSSSSPKSPLATCESSSGAPDSNRQAESSTSSLLLHNLNISSASSHSNERHNDLLRASKRASSSILNYANRSDSSPAAANVSSGLRFEDQAALMERVTRLQHDKWTLEEKLSYLEQANAALTQDLADKSHVIRQYFMDQATRSISYHNHHHSYESPSAAHTLHTSSNNNDSSNSHHHMPLQTCGDSSSRRVSFPNNFNQLLADKPSLKKMVDFLKERSQVSVGGESENITREATKKMQVMLEETLIKCIKLQENLDYVTSELNKLQT